MNVNDFELVEKESPSPVRSDDAAAALVDQVIAVAHLPAAAHVTVIGRHTLPLVLALMRRGCGSVLSLRPGAPSPNREVAELAWIVDVTNEDELDEALRTARGRAGEHGRVVIEGTECACNKSLAALRDHAVAAGLKVVSLDHVAGRLVLAPAACRAMAA
jgi:hypothetical protein